MISLRKAHTLKDYLASVKVTNRHQIILVSDRKVNIARFVTILMTQMSLKTLMGVSTIFVLIATQILLFRNFIVALVLNNT